MNKKGQSTVEYIILVTAVILVAVTFLVSKNSPFQSKMGNTMNAMTDQMGNLVNRMGGL